MSQMKTYGSKLNAVEMQDFLDYAITQNVRTSQQSKKGVRGTPICIWGTHGIGKTQSVIDFARRHDYT